MRAQTLTFREPTLVAGDGTRWTLNAAVHLHADGTAEVVSQVTDGRETRTLVEGARIATREVTRGGRVTSRTYQGLTGPYQQPIVGLWERTITRAAQRAAVAVAWRAVVYGSPIIERSNR